MGVLTPWQMNAETFQEQFGVAKVNYVNQRLAGALQPLELEERVWPQKTTAARFVYLGSMGNHVHLRVSAFDHHIDATCRFILVMHQNAPFDRIEALQIQCLDRQSLIGHQSPVSVEHLLAISDALYRAQLRFEIILNSPRGRIFQFSQPHTTQHGKTQSEVMLACARWFGYYKTGPWRALIGDRLQHPENLTVERCELGGDNFTTL
jgi:hypothetical protein